MFAFLVVTLLLILVLANDSAREILGGLIGVGLALAFLAAIVVGLLLMAAAL